MPVATDLPLSIIVHRRKGPAWVFEQRADFGKPEFYCNQRKYTYRLFVDIHDPCKPIWIGRWFSGNSPNDLCGWYTVEKEIGAWKIVLENGKGAEIIIDPRGKW